ncbi:ATP-binding protein [Rhodoplanes sp. TEM]|uniref:histidine kinase n=1 Tax=Rhodoplanes tepidamans TaxID=200616 RepID=A0ABT5JHR9_RHOTP|nr:MULTISPECIES: ATP-binding protein [Rhodoplanes]MDC7788916.1 ATP-binding protein [Rhodoplanes tepidamans]MDC7988107.1 ATP-binding protein [Rhodoplanes sp. TEM]MDQ0358748.1 signal transduction histidine kinase [Rhodoplanes tepidamans]
MQVGPKPACPSPPEETSAASASPGAGADKSATPGLSVRQRLILIVVMVALPMVLLSAATVWQLVERERASNAQAILYAAHSIMSAVEAQLGNYVAVGQALGESPALQVNDLVVFRGEAERATIGLPGAWVTLVSPDGQQLMNTLLPQDEALPRAPDSVMAGAARAFAERRVEFTDVVMGPVAGGAVVGAGVPVFRDGRPAYYLLIGVLANAFRDLLNDRRLPPGWLVGVVDREGNFVARSLDHDRWVGSPASAEWRAVMHVDGMSEVRSVEGRPLINATSVSRMSGWVVGVATERNVFEAPIRRTMITAVLVTSGVALFSMLLAGWAARRITGPIAALETGAARLERGELPAVRPTWVPEVDHALHALDTAASTIVARERALRENEHRMAAILDVLPVGVSLVDREGRTIVANGNYRRFVPRIVPSRDDARHPLWEGVDANGRRIPREDYPSARALRGEPVWPGVEFFFRGDATQPPTWTRVAALPFRDENGAVSGAVQMIVDIDQEKRAEEERRTLQAELLHLSRLSDMGQMAAALAHELNQPLTAVAVYIGGCQRLVGRDGLDEARRDKLVELMRMISEQALRAGEIIRQLRDFVRKGEGELRVVGAATLMREACTLALAAAKHKGVAVRLDLDAPGEILVNKVQIQQVVFNLVRNAVEAMETSERKELDIRLVAAGGHVEVAVADTGSGLAPEIADRLFMPFVSTKSQGMGIGLSVCRNIIEAHHGRIWAERNPAGGTVFRFRLPRLRDE